MASVWTKSVNRLALSIVQDLDITWYRSGFPGQLLIGPDTVDNAVRPSIARPCTDDLLGDHIDLLYGAVLDLLDDRWRRMRQDRSRDMTSITARSPKISGLLNAVRNLNLPHETNNAG